MEAMANRLADATSPYLLQHKDNPVDWWPWSEEAFAEATAAGRAGAAVGRVRGLPLVPRHGARVVRGRRDRGDRQRGFVPVKVDREERPDVDAVYMEATQGMTGQGGWPMTCFLTPDGAPFYCGTYFPKPVFQRLLGSVTEAWRDRRDDVRDAGQRIVSALSAPRELTPAPLDAGVLDEAAASLRTAYDEAAGGFGGAPKFPPSMVLEFLLRRHARAGDGLDMVVGTAEAMARGGMYDQLAGGFARYSVDAGWVVPHFEKMLYDNALLLRVYLHLWRETGSPLARRIVRETAAFLLGDLRTAEGGFASALDADAGRHRGPDVRVDAGAADRGARVRGRRVGGAAAVGHRGRHVRARLVHPAAAGRPGRPRPLDDRAGAAARRPGSPPAAGPGRQGRHRLERAGHRRSGRGRRAARRAGLGDRRGGRGRAAAGHPPGARPAAAQLPRRDRRRAGRRAGGLRRPGRRDCSRCTRRPGSRAGWPPRATCSTRCWPGSPTGGAGSTTRPTTPSS
jgi:hypothetical protein